MMQTTISNETIQKDILYPLLDSYQNSHENCTGLFCYVLLPIIIIFPILFYWGELNNIIDSGTSIVVLCLWGGLFFIMKISIKKQIKRRFLNHFIKNFPIGSMEFNSNLCALIHIESEVPLIVEVQNELIAFSGKTKNELLNDEKKLVIPSSGAHKVEIPAQKTEPLENVAKTSGQNNGKIISLATSSPIPTDLTQKSSLEIKSERKQKKVIQLDLGDKNE